MNQDVFLSLLSLDAYNRGSGSGLAKLDESLGKCQSCFAGSANREPSTALRLGQSL